MDELIQGLTGAGFSVQLAHDTAETTKADHGWVRVHSADGTPLTSAADVQHNRRHSQRSPLLQAMVAQVVAATAGAFFRHTETSPDGSDDDAAA